jgi:hypothetical protein
LPRPAPLAPPCFVSAGRGKQSHKDANLASFVTDTASKTGESGRSIARDATRAKALGADLDRVAGTSLDTGSELDALAKMPQPERQLIISRAASARVRRSLIINEIGSILGLEGSGTGAVPAVAE